MRVAYLDCFSGISGDMLLGALIHAGLDLDELRGELAKLGLDEFELTAERAWRDAMEGIHVVVKTPEGADPPHRVLSDIKAILAGSGLDPRTKDLAIAVFTRLAEAEAAVHGTTVDEVHFHEVGAVDAIVDIVGAVAGLACLGVEEVHCSKLVLGRGLQSCQHGEMPVPVPATLELLKDAPVVFSDLEGELVTPTGAALVSTLARSIGAGYSFVPTAIGYGFGTRVREIGPPNALRIVLGETEDEVEEVVLLETNLDDTSGQVIGFLIERCLASGALDAWATPIQMKKSRPGVVFSVLTDETVADRIERQVFAESGTLGVRRQRVQRARLERVERKLSTSLGEVRVKFARGPGGISRAAPEYDDVARLAVERGIPFRHAFEVISRELPPWPESGSGGD